MPKSGQYCDANSYFLKTNRELAVFSNSLYYMDGVGPLSPFCLPSRQPPPSQCPWSHIHTPPPRPRLRRGSLATSLKDRKWLMVPPRVRWVGSEGRWEREFQIRKVAQMGEWPGLEFQKWPWHQQEWYSPTFPDKHLKALLWILPHLFSQRDWEQRVINMKPKENGCKSLKQNIKEEASSSLSAI